MGKTRLIAVVAAVGIPLAADAAYRRWPSEPPSGCPFKPSQSIVGIAITGSNAPYTPADTWYPSLAADGNLCLPWTDGTVGDVGSSAVGPKATTGYASMVSRDPVHLQVINAGVRSGLTISPRSRRSGLE
jgi:hypothetical protein